MKKKLGLLLILCLLTIFGCTNSNEVNTNTNTKKLENTEANKEDKVIEIGCLPVSEPVVKLICDHLNSIGYNAEPRVFDGNHLPGVAVHEGSIDAFILTHTQWVEAYNKKNNSNLKMVEPYIYYFKNGLYSLKYDTIEELPNEATIAIPGDPSNMDRSLITLSNIGLIELGEKNGEFYTPLDITKNDKNLNIIETEVTSTVRSIKDVDAAILGALGLKNHGYDYKTFLYEDPTDPDYPIGLVINLDYTNEDEDWIKDALEYTKTKEFEDEFNKEYDGTFILID